MTSADFHVCYASVADALFEHIEQDLLLLTTALIDDDDAPPSRFAPLAAPRLAHEETPPP